MFFAGDAFFDNAKLLRTSSLEAYEELKSKGYNLDEEKYRFRVPTYQTLEEYDRGLAVGKESTIRRGIDAYEEIFKKSNEQDILTDGVNVLEIGIYSSESSVTTLLEYTLRAALRLKSMNPSAMIMDIHSHPKHRYSTQSLEASAILSTLPSDADFSSWSKMRTLMAGGIYSKQDNSVRVYVEPEEPEQVKVGYKLAVEYTQDTPSRVRWAGEDEVNSENLKLIDPTKDEWEMELHNLRYDIAQALGYSS